MRYEPTHGKKMKRFRQPPFSVIIPTLWRPATFLNLLEALQSSDHVQEVIVIDNARSFRPSLQEMNKVKLIDHGTNLFVNPSWNLGVTLAQSSAICICNDDILFAENLLGIMRQKRLRRVIGLHPSSYSSSADRASNPWLEEGEYIPQNWGSMLFLDKQQYVPIPDAMKIWWGDAWLAQEMGPALSVHTAIQTKHSESASSPEFRTGKDTDTELWFHSYKKSPSLIRKVHRRLIRLMLKLGV